MAAALVFACRGAAAEAEGAAEAAARVAARLDALDAWLDTSPSRGPGWRRWLKTDQLRAELARGAEADSMVVAQVLDRFESGAAGLASPRFAAVRRALADWLERLPRPSVERLLGEVAAAKEHFAPWDEARVARVRRRVEGALARLDAYLDGAAEGDRLRERIGWGAIQQALAVEGGGQWRTWAALAARFYQDEPGWEAPPLLEARRALRAYADALLFAAQSDLRRAYLAQLDQLAQRLAAYPKGWSPEDAYVIGRIAGWLERAGQAPRLVCMLRLALSRPNLQARLSGRFLSWAMSEPVDERMPLDEMILGTRVVGVAHTLGDVAVAPAADAEAAAFRVQLTATAYSDNVGYKGPVRIYSKAVTRVDASKQVRLDETGLDIGPTTARCRGTADIYAIAARCRLLERIAWRVALRRQPEAQCVADRLAERRVRERMDAQAAEMLGRVQTAFQDKFRGPLTRRDAFPRRLLFRSTPESVRIEALEAAGFQLAAPTPPPADDPQADLSIRLHESLANNFAELALGGRTLTDVQLAELVTEWTGETPEELQQGPEYEPWSITFAPSRSITVAFRGNVVRVAIRGRRFTRGDQVVQNLIEISAAYRVEKTATGARLARQGDVQIVYPGRTRLDVGEVAMKTFLRKKFAALFQQEVVTEGFVLPGQWERAGRMTLSRLYCDGGWVGLAWRASGPDR